MSWWVESNEPTACPGGWMNHMLCGVSRSTSGRLRLSAVLIYLALVGLHPRCYIEFWDPQYKDMLAKCGGCSWGPLTSLGVVNRCVERWNEALLKNAQEQWLWVAARKITIGDKERIIHSGQAMTPVTQRGWEIAILGDIQDLKGWGPGQPDLN